MSRLDKGLLFFYDWEECFEELPDKDFKELILAMLRYKKYGTPPTEFKGITKIAASLIFPQLDRQIKAAEDGKKGGRPKKDVTTTDNIIINEEACSSSSRNDWDELIEAATKKTAHLKAQREQHKLLLK